MTRTNTPSLLQLALATTLLAAGCGEAPAGEPDVPWTDPNALPTCGADQDAPLFDTLPVADAAIGEVIVFGELDPGGDDVIPNNQSGIRLVGQGIPLVAPGDGFIVGVRSSTFIESPVREGETDFGLLLRPCAEVTATLMHVTTLQPELLALLDDATCDTYSTGSETVDDCNLHGLKIAITAGQLLGTVGGASAGGFDFDMIDTRSVAHVTERGGDLYKNAVCFSRYFEPAQRALLESRTGLLGEVRTGDPACGTIEVDVAGSAQGVWVTKANPVAYPGSPDSFLTLAPDFLDPDAAQNLSLGGSAETQLIRVVRSFAGRTNRDFASVTEDALLYCYGDSGTAVSFFVQLSPGAELKVERVEHALGATPCVAAPETWAFSDAAVDYIR